MKITMMAAVARNGVIGFKGTMPWHIPEDLRFFRRTTMGKVLLVGRKTAQSLPPEMDGRSCIVLTRRETHVKEVTITWGVLPSWCVRMASNIQEALDVAHEFETLHKQTSAEEFELIVIGGADVYAAMMPHATHLLITHIGIEPKGDSYFPKIEPSVWSMTGQAQGTTTPPAVSITRDGPIVYQVVSYERTAWANLLLGTFQQGAEP